MLSDYLTLFLSISYPNDITAVDENYYILWIYYLSFFNIINWRNEGKVSNSVTA